ncbi:hypothetical protein P43SY_008215 [Pythium insidiosum]|uniref:Phospholipase A-2-activating protein n=1 Tax=Pythium insidiosum TaxID=114742 RepID=A0AAD5LF74_PYTIN|nr:hypothetical protein P43SY_008215 [Pythium insidiosum]
MTDGEFRLSCELQGHDGAIRAIAALPNELLVTGAMDTAVLSWMRDTQSSEPGAYLELTTARIYGHEHWVTALLPLPAGVVADAPTGGFVTGSMDKGVRIFDLDGKLVAHLRGHEGGVISLGLTHDQRYLLSGSWDGTARVWDLSTQQCVQVLSGHENGVCVLGLPDGTVVTGSTGRQVGNAVVDFQLRFWGKDWTLAKTVRDHAGPIRQLALLPSIGFVSCSNDGSIRVRTLDGDVVAQMDHPLNAEGKPGFVLGVAVLPDERIVSASEDCTARVWRADGSLQQTIEHPGGLWCVAALPNGDIVTGCDDKTARVFTTDATRASRAAEDKLVAAVEAARLTRARGPSGVEIERLPDYAQRSRVVGKSDGQIQMFRNGSKAWACQWSAPSKTWVDIGEVTGTGSGGVVDGKAYDMVIPVEIDQPGGAGVRRLEIGYNQGDNPFMVAQEFINRHMLDQNYLREIADYITQRSSEYQPPVIGSDSAPFASSSSDVASSTAATAGPKFKYFPVASYNTFETTKIAKLMTTVRQFNAQVAGDVQLNASELEALERTAKTVQDTAFYHSSSFSATETGVLRAAIARWPATHVFPLLDLLRLVLVHPQGPTALGGAAALESLVTRCLTLAADGSTADVPMATRMLALRVIANTFFQETARPSVVAKKHEVVAQLRAFLPYRQKTVALSLATLLLNLSRLGVDRPELLTTEDRVTIGSVAMELLNGAASLEELGEDTVLRALVSVGTVASNGEHDVLDAMAALLNVFLSSKSHEMKTPSVQECVEELTQCLGMMI